MKITLCGSVTFLEEMNKMTQELLEIGFSEVLLPVGFGGNERKHKAELTVEEDGQRKIEHNLIEKHYIKILNSDCVLIVNYTKNGVENYIGGNTLLEIGFAFVNKKPIYLLNPIPSIHYAPEILGMQPTILNGDIYKLKKLVDQYA